MMFEPGVTYGRLTLLEQQPSGRWLVRCACGNVITRWRSAIKDGIQACYRCVRRKTLNVELARSTAAANAAARVHADATCPRCERYGRPMHADVSGACVFDLVDEHGEMTLAQVGEHLGMTRERVRQIETVALKKLARLCHLRRVKFDDMRIASPEGWFDE